MAPRPSFTAPPQDGPGPTAPTRPPTLRPSYLASPDSASNSWAVALTLDHIQDLAVIGWGRMDERRSPGCWRWVGFQEARRFVADKQHQGHFARKWRALPNPAMQRLHDMLRDAYRDRAVVAFDRNAGCFRLEAPPRGEISPTPRRAPTDALRTWI